jgi:hypothetical protein
MSRNLYFGNDQADFGSSPVVWGNPGLQVFAGDPDYEIMGAYEIMGSPTASPAAKAAAGALIQAKAMGGKAVGQYQPRREYSQTLPCTSLAIAAGATRDIQLNPQRPFRPEKFRASSTHTAPFFVITAYSIGQDNQFVGPGSIPCDLFSEVALYSQIEAYTANLGNLITLTVQNIDVNIRDFRAAFFGTSLGN